MVTDKVVFVVNACAFLAGTFLGFYYGVKYRDYEDEYEYLDEDTEEENWTEEFGSKEKDPSPLNAKEYNELVKDFGYSTWVMNREHPQEEESSKEEKQYIINEDQFSEERFEYEKRCVTYYRGSKDLIDDLSEESLDIGFTVGNNVMKYILEELSDDNFVVYSRNDITSVDYEITMANGDAKDYGIGGTE